MTQSLINAVFDWHLLAHWLEVEDEEQQIWAGTLNCCAHGHLVEERWLIKACQGLQQPRKVSPACDVEGFLIAALPAREAVLLREVVTTECIVSDTW